MNVWCSYCETLAGLFNLATAPAPATSPVVEATFRRGDNGGPGWGYRLRAGTPVNFDMAGETGRLLWDPSHGFDADPFSSVAPVQLIITRGDAGKARWSVGTSVFLDHPLVFANNIAEIRITAKLNNPPAACLVQWDFIELATSDLAGNWEKLICPALPVASQSPVVTGGNPPPGKPQSLTSQTAVIQFNHVVRELHLRGQVSLRANHVRGSAADLGPDTMSGTITVYPAA